MITWLRFFSRLTSVALLLGLLLGCEGLTLGENQAGQDTYLSFGAIAVDNVTEDVFALRTIQVGATGQNEQWLVRIDPDSLSAKPVINLTGYKDVRILFPERGILIMAELEKQEQLVMFQRGTYKVLDRVDVPVRYHGTRMSPSRRWVIVADNTTPQSPSLHLIDTETMDIRVVPHGQPWLEAMWANHSDTLYVMAGSVKDDEPADMHLISYPLSVLISGGFTLDDDGFWAGRQWHVAVPDAYADLLFSFSWVGVSPNDEHIAFPMRRVVGEQKDYVVALMDTKAGTLIVFENARGPVGFTPDSSTMVSYRNRPDDGRDLLLVDVGTEATRAEAMPHEGGISFFVTRDENLVLVAPPFGQSGPLVLVDALTGKQTSVAGPSAHLTEFVSREGYGELWIADDGLFRLDLIEAVMEAMTITFVPNRINILPKRDLLVLGRSKGDSVAFFDPQKRTLREVPLNP